MKKNFKKLLAVLMAVMMLSSVLGVVAFAATYTVTIMPGRYANETEQITLGPVNRNEYVTLPDAMYTREGYTHAGWSNAASGSSKNYDFGDEYKVTGNKKIYPYWSINEYTVTFAPGADGVGTPIEVSVDYNKTTKFPAATAAFTREGYVQTGWTTVEGGEKEYNFGVNTPKITGDTTFYPTWEKLVVEIELSTELVSFGFVCEDYTVPATQQITITNTGNVTLNYTLPVSENYNISIVSGKLALEAGDALTVSVQPKKGLAANSYNESLVFACDQNDAVVTVDAKFGVSEHVFARYVSNGDATYSADGTKTAECGNKCGATDTIADIGSMKIYSADNNDAVGIASEYVHHRTVRFTAYGSGCDNEELVTGSKRYLPVSWYVNDEFNGNFDNGVYDVVFTHTIFGEYTLTLNFVEEEYNAETDTWTATGETDTKTFEYTVGTTAEEEQEIVRPNTITSIIFGLLSELYNLIAALFA